VLLAFVLLATTVFTDAAPRVRAFTTLDPEDVPLGTPFTAVPSAHPAECVLDGGRIDGKLAHWRIDSVIPAFLKGGEGVTLAPPATDLVPPEAIPDPPSPFGARYVQQPMALASPLIDDCALLSFDPLQAISFEQPGPHVFIQYDQRVVFVSVESTEAVTPEPCAANDPLFPDPSADIPPPPDTEDGKVWTIGSFCNTTEVTGMYVESTADCSSPGDMSAWPGFPYINQYDAGEALGLPESLHERGGDADGPSSLLMAMRRSGRRDLPNLTTVYNRTMEESYPYGSLAEPVSTFVGAKGVAFLKSMGWKSAGERDLGTTVETILQRTLKSLARGPIVVSTAFGMSRWGLTGGGHMIAIAGADQRGNLIANDPAGNWFSSHDVGYFSNGGHYGGGACGYRALYPQYWAYAYMTDRWLLELGPRTSPPSPKEMPRVSTTLGLEPRFGTAIGIYDAHPGETDTPRSFYLESASGRRAGWIDGKRVEKLRYSSASQDTPGWTAPAIGDETIAPWPDSTPAMPRAVVVPNLATGTKLFVVAAKGEPFAIVIEALRDGKLAARAEVEGTGTGKRLRIRSSALTALQ
jgi:hypothetical protein